MSGMVVLMNSLFSSLHTTFHLVPSVLVAPYVKPWPGPKLGLSSRAGPSLGALKSWSLACDFVEPLAP